MDVWTKSIMSRSLAIFWVGTFPSFVGSIRVLQLAEDASAQKGSFTEDRWTQLTLLVNIMTHTTATQSNLSVSSAVVSLFSSMDKRAG